jgi:hypothetical protein
MHRVMRGFVGGSFTVAAVKTKPCSPWVRRRGHGAWQREAFGPHRARPGDGFGWCPVTSVRVAERGRFADVVMRSIDRDGRLRLMREHLEPRCAVSAACRTSVCSHTEVHGHAVPLGLWPKGTASAMVGRRVSSLEVAMFNRAWWRSRATARPRPGTSGNRQAHAGRKTATVWRPFFGSGGEPGRRSLGLVRCGQTL